MRSIFVLSSLLAVLVIAAGSASAAVVAQLDGPTSYNPDQGAVILPDVTVGDEGSIELEFKANAVNGCLWYLADVWGGSIGEYRLQMYNDELVAFLWNSGSYAVRWATPFTDTTSWHSLRMAWKNGEDTTITLDGVTSPVANASTLADFTSATGIHTLGAYPNSGMPFQLDGEMRNVKVYDTYEQSASVVAQHDGPTNFSGSSVQTLPSVTVGDEGTLELEFKADSISGSIWYMADVYGGSTGEYRLQLANNQLQAYLWNSGSYAVQWKTPFTDTMEWHSLSMTWKEGEDTAITLDGVTTFITNAGTLADFTSGEGLNALGGYPTKPWPIFLLTGMTRNVTIDDTYSAPERLPGDASGDGKIDSADAAILAANWLVSGSDVNWGMGDFNGDDKVDDIDAAIMATNWTPATVADVPEPSMIVMLAVSILVAALANFRHRRSA